MAERHDQSFYKVQSFIVSSCGIKDADYQSLKPTPPFQENLLLVIPVPL